MFFGHMHAPRRYTVMLVGYGSMSQGLVPVLVDPFAGGRGSYPLRSAKLLDGPVLLS